jgi:hypothetical protein
MAEYYGCGCEDWPCCGHGSGPEYGDPEDAVDWLDGLDPEEREWAELHMTPCPDCGEMRPNDDQSMREHGRCWMCVQDGARRLSPTAAKNLVYFADRMREADDQTAHLTHEVERLRDENDALRERVRRLEGDHASPQHKEVTDEGR